MKCIKLIQTSYFVLIKINKKLFRSQQIVFSSLKFIGYTYTLHGPNTVA